MQDKVSWAPFPNPTSFTFGCLHLAAPSFFVPAHRYAFLAFLDGSPYNVFMEQRIAGS